MQSVSRCNKLFYKRRSCKKNLLQSGNVKIDLLQFPILLQDLLQPFYYIMSLLSYYYLYFVTNVTNVTKFQSKIFFYPFLGLIRISKMTRKRTIINPIASIIFLNTLFSFSSTYLFSTVVEAVTTGIFFSCVRVSTFSVSPLMETEVSIPRRLFLVYPSEYNSGSGYIRQSTGKRGSLGRYLYRVDGLFLDKLGLD